MTDDLLKLGYNSVMFVDLGAKDKTYYCDLLLSQQLLPAIRHVSSKVILKKTAAQHIWHSMFSDINVSQGSIAAPLR